MTYLEAMQVVGGSILPLLAVLPMLAGYFAALVCVPFVFDSEIGETWWVRTSAAILCPVLLFFTTSYTVWLANAYL